MELKSGEMPNTDFTYEEFEGFLASYYLTYQHLLTSPDGNQIEGFRQVVEILTRLAKRHGVQTPQDAIKNVRAKKEWGKPKKINAYWSVKDSFNAFRTDFGLIANEEDRPDIKRLWELINTPIFVFGDN